MKDDSFVLAAAVMCACLATAAGAATTKTVTVDCAKGDSINDALKSKADVLIVEIRGLCDEVVDVTRPNVTLRGTDPLVDGIRTTRSLPHGAALQIRGTTGISVENLGLSGHDAGLSLHLSFVTQLSNCRLEGSGATGAYVWAGAVALVDTVVRDNGTRGLVLGGGGRVTCIRCTISSSHAEALGGGIALREGSGVTLVDSTVQGNRAVAASGGSRVVIRGALADGQPTARIESLPHPTRTTAAVFLVGTSSLNAYAAAIRGPVYALENSAVSLQNVTQTGDGGGGANTLDGGSTLETAGASRLVGDVQITDFARASLRADTAVAGSLACSAGGDAYCDDPAATVAGTSTCGLCAKP